MSRAGCEIVQCSYWNGERCTEPGAICIHRRAEDTESLRAELAALRAENARLRSMVAIGYAGAALYTDDGELQDSRENPPIDFKRDSVDEILCKMSERTAKAFAELSPGAWLSLKELEEIKLLLLSGSGRGDWEDSRDVVLGQLAAKIREAKREK